MELPLWLQLKASRCYFVFLASGHILAGVAVCLLPLSFFVRAALLLVLALLMVRHWLAVSRYLPRLLLRADGKLEIHPPDGDAVGDVAGDAVLAEVGSDTFVWPGLVILQLRPESGKCTPLVLFPDSLHGVEMHRRLRIWLRWKVPF